MEELNSLCLYGSVKKGVARLSDERFMPMRYFIQCSALAALTVVAMPASSATFNDPTWPCVQRKVPVLSIGQMWSGPIPEEDVKQQTEDEALEVLAAALAVRRTSLEEAEGLVDEFAKASSENKDERLSRLFAAVLDRINNDRAQLISGIGRYAERQSGLSDRIGKMNEEIVVLDGKEDKTNDEFDKLEELIDTVEWDTRIFDERQQSLTYVCETPVILEKRAFSLARIMMEKLE